MKKKYLLFFFILILSNLAVKKSYCQINYGLKFGLNFDNVGDIEGISSLKTGLRLPRLQAYILGFMPN